MPFHFSFFRAFLKLCLVLEISKGKCKGNKIQRKSRMKEKMKKRLKVNNLFLFVTSKLFYLF